MLDFHTHILPGMDDGSRSVEQSGAMLRCEAGHGVNALVLTPHYYAFREQPERFLQRRSDALQRLFASQEDSWPQMYAGAEVAFFDGMSRTEQIDSLCIGESRVMLVEMPFCRWNRRILSELAALQDYCGIQPVLAHIERYLSDQPAGLVDELREQGVWIQANASFFLRWQTSWKALRMLKRQQIDFIGTDCHNMEQRAPNMGAAMKKISEKLGPGAMGHLQEMENRLMEVVMCGRQV